MSRAGHGSWDISHLGQQSFALRIPLRRSLNALLLAVDEVVQ